MKIKFENVNYKYNKKDLYAIKNINLSFSSSEIVFVMGETGSGKSTFLQHINGLLLANEGTVKIEIDNTLFELNKFKKDKNLFLLRKNIGFVFQFPEYQLFETTVLKDVMFGPLNFYKDESKAKELAVEALKKVGLSNTCYDKSPFELSGGEKRKVAIAGVLSSNPSVLIMDEPTSSLDSYSSKQIMNIIKNLKNEGRLIIIISHDVDLCYEYADRVILFKNGEVIKDCLTNQFFDSEITNLPFVYKAKKYLNIEDGNIRNIQQLKEVLNYE